MIWDVVIVGSGVAGALTAYKLSKKNLKVLILEAGPAHKSRSEYLKNYFAREPKAPSTPYNDHPLAPRAKEIAIGDYIEQNGPDIFGAGFERLSGGTTWHWLGNTPRMSPEDFHIQDKYAVGIDWPLTYQQLEKYYTQAEINLGVACDRTSKYSPRSQNFPKPGIPQSYMDKQIAKAINGQKWQGISLEVRSIPQARDPARCFGSRTCLPICPMGAKYEAQVHIYKAIAQGANLVTEAVAHYLELGSGGEIKGVRYKRWDGSSGVARGKVFVIAANGIETPKLLLMSAQAGAPNGIANSSSQVGRNLMDHPIQLTWAKSKEAIYPHRGPIQTAGVEDLSVGEFRKQIAACRIAFHNDGWSWPTGSPRTTAARLIAQGLYGKELNAALRWHCDRELSLSGMIEQLPDPSNRVTLSNAKDGLGLPRPKVTYKLGTYERKGLDQAKKVNEFITQRLGADDVKHHQDFFSAGHIMGTHRMGKNPKTSVVDSNSRSHDHRNLYLLGSGVFPTGGTANPTLTIAALALKSAEHIAANL